MEALDIGKSICLESSARRFGLRVRILRFPPDVEHTGNVVISLWLAQR